jgi:hypothetical protein
VRYLFIYPSSLKIMETTVEDKKLEKALTVIIILIVVQALKEVLHAIRKWSRDKDPLPANSNGTPVKTNPLLSPITVSILQLLFVIILVGWIFMGPQIQSSFTALMSRKEQPTLPPTGVWNTMEDPDLFPRGLRYQWYQFGRTDETRVPITECPFYTHSREVQEALLLPIGEIVPIPASKRKQLAMDSHLLQELRAQQEVIHSARVRASSRCALVPEEEWLSLDTEMRFLAEPHQPSIFQILDSIPMAKKMLEDAPVSEVLMTHDLNRYLRVLAIRPELSSSSMNPKEGGKNGKQQKKLASHTLGFYMMTEKEITVTASRWLQERYDLAETSVHIDPCLCLAYFGILGSGMHLHFAGGSSNEMIKSGDLDAMKHSSIRRTSWNLWLSPKYKSHNAFAGKVESNITHIKILGSFPRMIHEKLNISRERYPNTTSLIHHKISSVEYIQLDELLAEGIGETRVSVIDPHWVHHHHPAPVQSPPKIIEEDVEDEEEDEDEKVLTTPEIVSAPLLQIFPLSELAKGAVSEISLTGGDNACFAYCQLVDEAILEHVRKN